MKTTWLAVHLVITSAVTLSVVASGCQKTLSSAEIPMTDSDGAPMTVASRPDAPKQAGALLWTQNCMRCHNLRNPMERSDREWDVIMHHMRVRANLTVEEHRLILAFLQSAN